MKHPLKTRIAIAGDHEQLRSSLSSLLTLQGYDVMFSVSNGKELLEQLHFAQILPTLCIIDYRMPEMDGIFMASSLKTNFPEIRLVMYTMEEREDIRSQALQSGVDAYVLKGGCISKLYAALNDLAPEVIY